MKSTTASVLLVSRGLPPYAASLGGAIRILKLAEYLRDQGMEVHVLAGKGRNYGYYGYEELLRSISVHYVDDPLLARSGPPAPGDSQPAAQGRSGIRGLLRPLVTECSIPDTGIFALPALKRRAMQIIESRGITNIITSGPPHSDHLVGLAAKRKLGAALNWIVDYRDSWNGTSIFRKNNWLFQRLNLALEKRVLRRADRLTYISEPMIEKAAALLGSDGDRLRNKSTLIMNGYDARNLTPVSPWTATGSRLRIGYFGLLDDRPESYRSPATLFEAIINNDLDVSVELYGQIRISPHWSQVLGDRLVVGGLLSHAESMARMASMDALLLLHTRHDGADEVLTGKIFEYLLSGRPVLAVGPERMAANVLLHKLQTGHDVRHDDPAAVTAMLRRLWTMKRDGELSTRVPAGIEQYSRDYQYSLLKALLWGAAGKGR